MEVNCPVCNQLFLTSMIDAHVQHCMHASNYGKPNNQNAGAKKRMLSNSSENQEVASYPRKRQYFAGEGSSLVSSSSNASYYPKEPLEYRRPHGIKPGQDSWKSGAMGEGVRIAPPAPLISKAPAFSHQEHWQSGSLPSQDKWGNSSANVTQPSSIKESNYGVSTMPHGHLMEKKIYRNAIGENKWNSWRTKPYQHPRRKNIARVAPPVRRYPRNIQHDRNKSVNYPPRNANKTVKSEAVNSQTEQPSKLKELSSILGCLKPSSLKDLLGYESVLSLSPLLKSCLSTGESLSLILNGPPGCGKSTVGEMLCKSLSSVGSKSSYKKLCGAVASKSELLEVLEDTRKEGERSRLILLIDDIDCMKIAQQSLLIPFLDKNVTLIGVSSNETFVSQLLLDRCQLIHMNALKSSDIEKILLKALRVLNIPVISDEPETYNPIERNSNGAKSTNIEPVEPPSNSTAPSNKTTNDSSREVNNTEEKDNSIKSTELQSSNSTEKVEVVVKTEITTPITKTVPEAPNKITLTNDGLAIEDMSEEETILDVLTKDLNEFGEEFHREEEEFPLPRYNKSSLNDLDCVSEDELSLTRENANLESIVSSEEEDGDGITTSGLMVAYEGIRYLAKNSTGNIRFAEIVLMSAFAFSREDGCGSKETYRTDNLITDDISSDEENFADQKHNTDGQESDRQLDSVSDISDTSVSENKNAPPVDSDDVLSDDLLDYDAMDDENDNETKKLRQEPESVNNYKKLCDNKESVNNYKQLCGDGGEATVSYPMKRKRSHRVQCLVSLNHIKKAMKGRLGVSPSEDLFTDSMRESISKGISHECHSLVSECLESAVSAQRVATALLSLAADHTEGGDRSAFKVALDCVAAVKLLSADGAAKLLTNTAVYIVSYEEHYTYNDIMVPTDISVSNINQMRDLFEMRKHSLSSLQSTYYTTT